MAIIIDFRYDRWEVIQKYGFREVLIAVCATREEAHSTAQAYRQLHQGVA